MSATHVISAISALIATSAVSVISGDKNGDTNKGVTWNYFCILLLVTVEVLYIKYLSYRKCLYLFFGSIERCMATAYLPLSFFKLQ